MTNFHGCLKNLKLDDEYVELRQTKASKGAQHSCANREIRVASLVSERSTARYTTSTAASGAVDRLHFALRIRTNAPTAHILTVATNTDELARLSLAGDAEKIVVRADGATLEVPLATSAIDRQQRSLVSTIGGIRGLADGWAGGARHDRPINALFSWHYIDVLRIGTRVVVSVDDTQIKEETAANDIADLLSATAAPDEALTLTLGRAPGDEASGGDSFVGCIGDVVLNEKLVSFGSFVDLNEVQLTGCSLDEAPATATTTTTASDESATAAVTKPADVAATIAESGETATAATSDANAQSEATTIDAAERSTPKPASSSLRPNVRPSGACALPLEPHGEREDMSGLRFGLEAGSRLEFSRLPENIDRRLSVAVELRSNSANGIIFFVSNEKHTDHFAVSCEAIAIKVSAQKQKLVHLL